MFHGLTISVVIPCYNEFENIKFFIEQVLALNIIDEIIVVDNNSKDGSRDQILQTPAHYVYESDQGYGAALQRGIREAKCDFIITVEPDGTFDARDIYKFLAYKDDFDVVLGTRTTSELIWDRAYMPHWVRFGNVVCAKLIQVLFSGPSLSDVGCTYKAFNREVRDAVIDDCKVKGSYFSPELIIRLLTGKFKIIEIPVNYRERVGQSKITGGNTRRTFFLGLRMFIYIFEQFGRKMIWRNTHE